MLRVFQMFKKKINNNSSIVVFSLQLPRGPEDGPLCERPPGVDAAAASV